jgi:hypothetical protein
VLRNRDLIDNFGVFYSKFSVLISLNYFKTFSYVGLLAAFLNAMAVNRMKSRPYPSQGLSLRRKTLSENAHTTVTASKES